MGKSRRNAGDRGGTGTQRLLSRQWSASALAQSNDQLLGAKTEVDEEADKRIQETCIP